MKDTYSFSVKNHVCRLLPVMVAAIFSAVVPFKTLAGSNDSADLSKSLGDSKDAASVGWVRRTDPAMEKWRANRFGIMIHWGIYSELGGWWHGREIHGAAEWIKAFAKIPSDQYDALVKQFDPTNYDPVAWARLFKAAGAKYVIITTKHHDGFCLWDSKFTDFDMGSTPYKKGVLKPLADAVRAEGMDMGFYYSIIDWHNPDYRSVIRTPEDAAAYKRYLQYMKNQIKELLTEFGPIRVMWFDGEWDSSYKTQPQIGRDLETYCRKLSPGIIINNRIRAYDGIADYNSGFERRLPDNEPATDWESCMTMTENSWGYHRTWSGNGWKTPGYLCEMLSRCASMNGNFLVNIGPKPDGTIRVKETVRLDRIGRWLKVNGNAIYGTRAFKINGLPDGIYSTRNGNHVYLIAFHWPDRSKLTLKGLSLASASLLTTDGPRLVSIENGDTLIGLPMEAPDPIGSVFSVELKKAATDRMVPANSTSTSNN